MPSKISRVLSASFSTALKRCVDPSIVMMEHPWLLSTSTRTTKPSFFSMFKQRHFLGVGLDRLKKTFVGYDVQYHLPKDGSVQLENLFDCLSDPTRIHSLDQLSEFMTHSLAQFYIQGNQSLNAKGLRTQFHLESKPKLFITGIHFTYGPYPPPPGYVYQHWWSILTLALPEQEMQFESYPRQKELVDIAKDQGTIVRIQCKVHCPITFQLIDNSTNEIVHSDQRFEMNVEFTSPHFTTSDEVLELDGEEWKLRWKWKLSDIDALISSH